MCYESDARAPLPSIVGASDVARTADLVLTSSDGTEFLAFEALTTRDDAPGIVIMPDVRGLHPFFKDLAARFAQAGVHAVAIDYFGRTAGTDVRPDDFDHEPHVEETTPDAVANDVFAGMQRLSSETPAMRFYTVGFCFGGRKSFNQAARQEGLDGVIGFYGFPQRFGDDDEDPPIEAVDRFGCKVLGLFGGADQAIPVSAVDEFREALDGANVPNEIVVYDGATHSFFDRGHDEYREACDDAWRRILAFVGVT